MDNVEITEDKLTKSNWKKIGNTFYRNGKAITHFDAKFQVWANGEYHHVKTMQEIQNFSEIGTKKA